MCFWASSGERPLISSARPAASMKSDEARSTAGLRIECQGCMGELDIVHSIVRSHVDYSKQSFQSRSRR